MARLYVTEPGARVGKKGGHIVVSRENEVICEVPSETLEGVIIIDSVQVTSAAVSYFLAKEIPVTWLSSRGKYYGRLESTQSHDVFRLKEQFELTEDKDFCLQLAKKIVSCKIYNQRIILRNYNRRVRIEKIDNIYKKIKSLLEKIDEADSVKAVMGYEGSIARLHPYVGFLHALRNGHPVLASDLMEPWRPAVVDSLCLSLVARKEIDADSFEESDDGGVYLSRMGRKKFIREYERKMNSVNAYFGGKYSWRHTIQMECDSYGATIHQKNIDVLKPIKIR